MQSLLKGPMLGHKGKIIVLNLHGPGCINLCLEAVNQCLNAQFKSSPL